MTIIKLTKILNPSFFQIKSVHTF